MQRLKALQEYGNERTKYYFKDTIERHSQGEIHAIRKEEVLVPPGDYITKETEIEIKVGAIVSVTNQDLKADAGGNFSHNTRKLYCYVKLGNDDKIVNTMNDGTKQVYTILAQTNKSDFDDGLHIYYLERSDLND